MSALVSVVVPTYDRPALLKLTLESVLAQTYSNLEIIVQDNCSPQNPWPVIEALGNTRIKFYRNERNEGPSVNIITSMYRASGKYVAILADDDLWKPDFLTRLVPALEANPDCVAAFSFYDVIDEFGKVDEDETAKRHRYYGYHLLARGYYEDFEAIATVYRTVCVVSGCVLRRGVIDLSVVPMSVRNLVDIYLAHLAARTGASCYFDPDRLFQVRHHGGILSLAIHADAENKVDVHAVGLSFWDILLKDQATRYKRYYRMRRGQCAAAIVYYLARMGKWGEANHSFVQSVRSKVLTPSVIGYYLGYAALFRYQGLRRRWP